MKRQVIIFFLICSCLQAWAQKPAETVSKSIVMVSTTQSDGPDVRASGFVWPDKHSVVTSYHVIADSASVQVSYDDGQNPQTARVVKVYPERDLALLQVDSPPDNATTISIASDTPPAETPITLIGYPQNIGHRVPLTGITMDQGSGGAGKTLDEFLQAGTPLYKAIKRLGFPKFDTTILAVQLVMQPGVSGSPIVNDQGQVVGIADGGLEDGTTEINWAIPADALTGLQNSAEEFQAIDSKLVSNLFGAELNASTGPVHRSGKITLTRLRTRTLAQLTMFNDDPMGLNAILNGLVQEEGQAQGRPINLSSAQNWKFDLYRVGFADSQSNFPADLTVVVPEGISVTLGEGDGEIKAATGDVDLYWKAQFKTADDGAEAIKNASDLESQATNFNPSYSWSVDNSWSYPIAHLTNRGVVIQRRALGAYSIGTPIAGVPLSYANFVHAFYQKASLDVGLVSLHHREMFYALLNPAFRPPGFTGHQQLWAKFTLATVMSGVPAYATLNSDSVRASSTTVDTGTADVSASTGNSTADNGDNSAPPPPSAPDPKKIARLLASGKFAAVRALCTPSTAQQLPDQLMGQVWAVATSQVGAFQSADSVVDVTTPNGFPAKCVKCSAANGSILVTVQYDSDNQVAGLWVNVSH